MRPLLAFALALAACSPSPNPDAGPGPATAERVFPEPGTILPPEEGLVGVDQPKAVEARELKARAELVGATSDPSQVRFIFDHPVARAEGAQPARVRVTPEVAVDVSWLRGDTLVVKPSTRWPDATRVKVKLDGLESSSQTLSAKVATEFVAQPLAVANSAGSLLYPNWLSANEQITLWFNQPVPLPSSELIRLEVAKSREDLSAMRTSPVKAALSATTDPKVFRIAIAGGPAVGHWYRLTVSGALRGIGPEPLGADFTSIFRGPDPFGVTGFSCGWPRCTSEDKWTFNFNGEPDEKSFASCLSVTPSIPTRISKEGWSLVLEPVSPKHGETYRLTLSARCRDQQGQTLGAPYVASVLMERPTPRLSMVTGTGYLAPADGPQTIAVETHHTQGVEVALQRLAPTELPTFLNNHLEDWSGLDLSTVEFPKSSVLTTQGALALDLGPALVDGRGLVLVRAATVHPDHPEDVTQRLALVQVTDLGLVAKSGPQDTLVWVTSLTDRAPREGVTVELLTRAGEVLWTATTDARGIATGPGVNVDEDDTKAGRVVVARLGQDTAFLDLRHWQSRSDPYDFGLPYEWNPKSDVLRGQVFTERGVYRTAEKVYIKGFARFDRGRALEAVPAGALGVTIHDSRGNAVHRGEAPLGPYGDFDLAFDLPSEAPLGTWRITASAISGEPSGQDGAAQGTPAIHGNIVGSFRVEAYRASTFEVKVRDLAISGEKLTARVEGAYYAGPAMAESDVTWWVTASRASFTPKGYEGFSFDGADADLRWWEPTETSVPVSASGKGKLDKDGAFSLEAELGEAMRTALSSGPKTLQVEAEVTDVDQQTITGRETLRVESADAYVGLKLSDRFVSGNARVTAEIVALTPKGELVEPKRATLRFLKRTWNHRYEDVAGGGREWVSSYEDEVLHEAPVTGLARGRVSVSLEVKGSGTFVAEVLGEDSAGRKVAARTQLYAWGEGASWSDNEGRLTVIEEKASWRVGETARYIVQSPFPDAKALITIERSGVIERRVMDLIGSAPVVEVPVTADMAPNAYVSFALLGTPRPLDPEKGAASRHAELRLGYARLQVDTADRRLDVSVTPAAERYRPGERATVKLGLRDASGAPMAGQVTLMVVDEGVLSLTAYKTPDPHAALHVERPLSVTTVDARKSLWQRLTADEGMKSDWGGGGEGGEPQNYRSAFATTAAFLPNVIVPDSGETEVSFALPDNLTRFRVMAVAATRDGRFGSAQSRIEVNKPLMVRPALPRFASVGDVFDARSVLTRIEGEGPVDVEVSVSGPVALEEGARKQVELGASSKPVTFRVKALAPGVARFRVVATSKDGISDAFEIPLPIAWPATMSKTISTGWLAGTGRREVFRLEVPEHLRADAGGLSIAVAPSRLNELLPSLDYLLQYPYGCVEQTTGGTLPLLALNELLGGFELPGITREAVLTRAKAGLARLRSMQTWSGGLGYWPGDTTPHPWGSAYAGLAFAAAAKSGTLDVGAATLDGLRNYLRDILRGQAAAARDEWREELDQVKPLAAFVLAQLGSPELAFNNQLFELRQSLPDFGKLLLALAIDESKGPRAMVDALLDDVLTRVSSDQAFARLVRKDERYYGSTMDSDLRSNALLVMALERTRPSDPLLPKLVAAMMADRREGHWGNTQDNAFALLALAGHFVRTEANAGPVTVKVLLDGAVLLERRFEGKGLSPASLSLPMAHVKAAHGKRLEILREGGDGPLYWTLSLQHAPAEIPRRGLDHGLRLDRRYVFAEGPRAGELARDVQAGDLLRVELTLQSDTDQRYIAIDDPLPAGVEPVLLSLATSRGTVGDEAGGDGYDWSPAVFNHTEQRDDRVNVFADWLPKGTHTHSYLVRATTHGSFLAPAAFAHAMYSPQIAGRSDAHEMVVR